MRHLSRPCLLSLATALLLVGAGPAAGRERKGPLRLPKLTCEPGQPAPVLAEAGLQAADVGEHTTFTSEQARAFKLALRCLELATSFKNPPAALPPRTLVALGRLYERLDQPTDAWQAYHRFLREVPVAQRPRDLTVLAERRSEALLSRLGQLLVQAPAGLEIAVDGRPVGLSPLMDPIGVAPGRHTVRLGPAEQATAVLEVEVDAGRTEPVTFTDAVAPPRPALLSTPQEPPRRPAWRIGLGSASLIGAALVIGFGGSALSVNGQCVQAGCPVRFDNGNPVRDRFSSAAFGGGLVGAGGALLVAGIVLLALPPPRPATEPKAPLPL